MDRWLSLFGDEPAVGSTRTRPAAPVAKTQTRHDAQRQDAQRRYADWRGDVETLAAAWEELHVWFLQRHLKLLASVHTERAEREDILAWLEAPIVPGRPAALSAQACLAIYDGRIDPLEFQRAVRRLSQRVAAPRRAAA